MTKKQRKYKKAMQRCEKSWYKYTRDVESESYMKVYNIRQAKLWREKHATSENT